MNFADSFTPFKKSAPGAAPFPPKTLKYSEERYERVKKTIFTFIQDNNVEIINNDQIYYEGKNYTILGFADKAKFRIENLNKKFPILTVEEYVELIRELNADNHRAKMMVSTNLNSKFLNEAEILSYVRTDRLDFSKSIEQAQEFLTHILFKIAEQRGFVKVIAKRKHKVLDENGNEIEISQEILLPGYKHISEYEDTLRTLPVKGSINDKQLTYWDVFSKSKAVMFGSLIYNPHKDLYWCDEFKHYYINTYKQPYWKDQPQYYELLLQHKTDPMTFDKLGDNLRSFLIHLFPDDKVRFEVLKWCAFSTTDKLQTYLTLIGSPGIGKNVFVEDFLGYYHGNDNLNIPKKIEVQFNDGFSKSTILFFDEKTMTSLDQYNEMKSYINRQLSFEEKNRPIHKAENFANIVWSCNTKDTMTGMSRDDRRFKIVPVTGENLLGAPIKNLEGEKIGVFTSATIKDFVAKNVSKREFVLLMLSIRDYVNENEISKDDINTISDNDARDLIFSESRSSEFIEIVDVLKNVYNDYNEVTGKPGSKNLTQVQKEELGTVYNDYIPLSRLMISSDPFYSYRVPFSVIRKVMEAKAGKVGNSRPMALRNFNKHLNNMPPKIMKGIPGPANHSDIDIRLNGKDKDSFEYFRENYYPMLLKKFNEFNELNKSK